MYINMLIELFKTTLEQLGEDTVENILAALTKINTIFMNKISDMDVSELEELDDENDEFISDAMNFVGYFLDNYGEQTEDSRYLNFNGEIGIIEFTQFTVTETIRDDVLNRANENLTKKNEFDIKKLRNEIIELFNTNEDVFIESLGVYSFDDDLVSMSSDLALIDFDEEENDSLNEMLKMLMFSEEGSMFIQCGDGDETMTVYGVSFKNQTWQPLTPEKVEESMDENWLEEQEDYGYTNIEFSQFQNKF